MRPSVEILLAQMEKAGVDAALITMPENRRYYSGFTGSSGLVFVHPQFQYLITDFRYIEQGKKQCPGYEIIDAPGQKTMGFLQEICSKLGVHTLWFEEEHVTYQYYLQLSEALKEFELLPAKGALSKNRVIKSPQEIASIRSAAALADVGFSHLLEFIKEGMTEKQVALELEFFLRREGAQGLSFDTIIASGENGALPHAQPTDKPLERGDLVVMDYGCVVDGYCSDMTRTVAIGQPSEQLKEIYQVTLDAQLRALEGIKAGVTGIEADRVARDYIQGKGYGDYFGHGLGHGVGLQIHEAPTLSPRGEDSLETHMVVTVEPGIYLPGQGGVRIEDLVVVTQEGIDNLTTSSKKLYML